MAEEYNYDEYEQRISELESNLEQLNPRYSSRRKGKY